MTLVKVGEPVKFYEDIHMTIFMNGCKLLFLNFLHSDWIMQIYSRLI